MKNYYDIMKEIPHITPTSVLEIGSRDGHDANKLSTLFGIEPSKVHVIEPHPTSYKYISETYPHFNLYEVAISDVTCRHPFIALKEDVGVSSLRERNDNFYNIKKKDDIYVDCYRGCDFLTKYNLNELQFDVCKIDVEGLTYEVLDGFGSSLKNIKSMHIECEYKEIWKNQKTRNEVFDFLERAGYYKIYEKNMHNVQSDSIWILK